jgi:hypothetical protein
VTASRCRGGDAERALNRRFRRQEMLDLALLALDHEDRRVHRSRMT